MPIFTGKKLYYCHKIWNIIKLAYDKIHVRYGFMVLLIPLYFAYQVMEAFLETNEKWIVIYVIEFLCPSDIDECASPNDNSCLRACHNTPGSYRCSCPAGFQGDGRSDGEGCRIKQSFLVLIVVGQSYFLELFGNKLVSNSCLDSR